MSRYLIVGAGGMLGTDLQTALAGREVTALSRAELDITDPDAVHDAVAGHDVVINAAAYTKVDDAESNEHDALIVNGTGPGVLAEACAEIGARLVQVSTDYVFDGSASDPYAEGHARNPQSAYGRTKAAGELASLAANPGATYIVRTAWLYGRNGGSFPTTMLRLAGERETVDVVVDQVGQPTWTEDVAARIVQMLDADAPVGIYHATNSGQASWFEFARATFELAGLDPDRVHPTDSGAFRRPAPRPGYSVLGHDAWARAGIPPMRPWRDALADAISSGALGAPGALRAP